LASTLTRRTSLPEHLRTACSFLGWVDPVNSLPQSRSLARQHGHPDPKMNIERKKGRHRNPACFQRVGLERATRFELATKSLGSMLNAPGRFRLSAPQEDIAVRDGPEASGTVGERSRWTPDGHPDDQHHQRGVSLRKRPVPGNVASRDDDLVDIFIPVLNQADGTAYELGSARRSRSEQA
jgi:hypothetical protein